MGGSTVEVTLVSSPTGCKKCAACEQMMGRLIEKYGEGIVFRKITSEDPEAMDLGVVMPPMLLVGNLLVVAGKVPNETKLDGMIAKKLAEG